MHAIFDHAENANPAGTARTFWFKPVAPLRYVAGQFVEMQLPQLRAEERSVKRWFTLSSSPTEDLISITTKAAPQKASLFKKALLGLRPGEEVIVSEPMGDFVLPKDTAIPLLFAAGGIGVTPMRSMIKWLRDTGEKRQVTLLYAVNRPDELAFQDLFSEAPGIDVRFIVARPPLNWRGHSGRLTPSLIVDSLPRQQQPLIYISGPEPMVESLEKALLTRGIDQRQLVLDFFPGYLN